MSYIPTEWTAGDIVTAAKLNKLENGVAESRGSLIVNMTYNAGIDADICDKTALEMYTAFQSGSVILKKVEGTTTSMCLITSVNHSDDGYYSFMDSYDLSYVAENDIDYPISNVVK